MPRHTHPRPRAKHARAETRHQRQRQIDRRWARLKSGERVHDSSQSCFDRRSFLLSRYAWRPLNADERSIADAAGQAGPYVSVHPEVARALPPQLREYLGGYAANLNERLYALPRRFSYAGHRLDPWGWGWPARFRFAVSKRLQDAWKNEVADELAEFGMVWTRYGNWLAYEDTYSSSGVPEWLQPIWESPDEEEVWRAWRTGEFELDGDREGALD